MIAIILLLEHKIWVDFKVKICNSVKIWSAIRSRNYVCISYSFYLFFHSSPVYWAPDWTQALSDRFIPRLDDSFQTLLGWVCVWFLKKNYKQLFLLFSLGNLASLIYKLHQLSLFFSVVCFPSLNVASKCLHLALHSLPLSHLLPPTALVVPFKENSCKLRVWGKPFSWATWQFCHCFKLKIGLLPNFSSFPALIPVSSRLLSFPDGYVCCQRLFWSCLWLLSYFL